MEYKIEHRQVDVKTGRVMTKGWEDWSDADGNTWTGSYIEAQREVREVQGRCAYFVWTRLEFRIVKSR